MKRPARASRRRLRAALGGGCAGEAADPRLREVIYDPRAVVTVPVKRGVVTLVVLDADESITEVGGGLGGDCSEGRSRLVHRRAARRPQPLRQAEEHGQRREQPRRGHRPAHAHASASWCWPTATRSRRCTGSSSRRLPRPAPPASLALREDAPLRRCRPAAASAAKQQVVAERLQAKPQVMNTSTRSPRAPARRTSCRRWSSTTGASPTCASPATAKCRPCSMCWATAARRCVNARMEDDLLVVDRVSRRLMLRAGSAVVGLWNEAFDLDGDPSGGGTTVPGVQRVSRPTAQHQGASGGSAP
jgi:type IV secretion system protein VirB9